METMLINKCASADFKKTLEKKGYAFFTKGDYNLNIIGIRHDGNRVTNHFDDCIAVIYNNGNKENITRIFKCTTLPGKKAMEHPVNVVGTAILKEGQYRGAYKIGKHKGQYTALVQSKPLPVYRDGNKDDVFDFKPHYIDNGIFGINIHKAGNSSVLVDGWSYGCQVFQSASDFSSFMALVNKAAKIYGNSFTYTLINEKDLCF